MNPQIDQYLAEGCMRCKLGGTPQCKVHSWQQELKLLRKIAIECGLIEELKWSIPCYTFQNQNIAVVAAFKDFASFSFFKGVLLKDEQKLLHKSGENSQSARFFKFTEVDQILEIESTIKAYIFEAIENEKAGLKVEFKQKNELEYPEELLQKFEEFPEFKAAFEALTPGRKRGYVLNFTQPKQTKTRVARIEKNMERIFNGKGIFD